MASLNQRRPRTATLLTTETWAEALVRALAEAGVDTVYAGGIEVFAPAFLPQGDFHGASGVPALQVPSVTVIRFSRRGADGITWLRQALEASDVVVTAGSGLASQSVAWLRTQMDPAPLFLDGGAEPPPDFAAAVRAAVSALPDGASRLERAA